MIVSAVACATGPSYWPLATFAATTDSTNSSSTAAAPVAALVAALVADPATMLADPNKSFTRDQRAEAARRLLSQHTDESKTTLRNALISPDIDGQYAVAQALANDPDPDPSFIDPLFPLLNNSKLATIAGRALSGYKGVPSVLSRLIDTAARRGIQEFTRIAAIRAIGSMPERRAAAQLITLLTAPEETSAVHEAAADALVEMTGLDQNGRDPARWNDWWKGQQNQTDAAFRQDIITRHEARLDRQTSHLRSLAAEIDQILSDQYNAADLEQRHAMALKFLNSSEPEIRSIGTRLISNDVLVGQLPSSAELSRLRDMVSDSSPVVRKAVADTISRLNDPASLDALLNQLRTEPDPTVRAEIAIALGPIHDPNLRAIPILIKLLDDDSLPTAEAAARALAIRANGPLANDVALSRKTAEALRDTALKRASTPGAQDLVASCIAAIAPLHQPDIIRQLQNAKMLNFDNEGKGVRGAMEIAIGELRDPGFADSINRVMQDDPDEDVQRQAIEALAKNPDAPKYAQNVGDLLKPEAARKQSVRDAAWQFLRDVFPKLTEQQLAAWEQRFKDDPQRNIVLLQIIADKEKAGGDSRLPDLATTQSQIGDVYKSIKDYDAAAEHFRAALDIYGNQGTASAAPARFNELERSYMNVLLRGKRFGDAIDFATLRIKADPAEQYTMGPRSPLKPTH